MPLCLQPGCSKALAPHVFCLSLCTFQDLLAFILDLFLCMLPYSVCLGSGVGQELFCVGARLALHCTGKSLNILFRCCHRTTIHFLATGDRIIS
jgi:hypothetical protein